jgi:4-amino-4-deoxy-L-arabinose transferase-like glycosyltransferase
MIATQTHPPLIRFYPPKTIGWILGLALILRLIFVLIISPTPQLEGGDSPILLQIGRELLTDTSKNVIPTGPVYVLLVGLLQQVVGVDSAPQLIRFLNTILGMLVCGWAYLIGKHTLHERVGLLAALFIAINPIFIIESGAILTESLFVCILYASFALYAVRQAQSKVSTSPAAYIGVGLLLGLATLTRAITLLLPLVFVAHLILTHRRAGVKWAAILLISYGVTLAPWTVYNAVRWNKLVIGAEGLLANIWLGASPVGWCGPACTDANAGITKEGQNAEKYTVGTLTILQSDLPGYLSRRLNRLFESTLQPHNTVYFVGESIKESALRWWSEGRTLEALRPLIETDGFGSKLTLYIFHYFGLGVGLLSMILNLRRWGKQLLVWYGTILYFYAIHTILMVIPRYLFPLELVWGLFAVTLIWQVWERATLRTPQSKDLANRKP